MASQDRYRTGSRYVLLHQRHDEACRILVGAVRRARPPASVEIRNAVPHCRRVDHWMQRCLGVPHHHRCEIDSRTGQRKRLVACIATYPPREPSLDLKAVANFGVEILAGHDSKRIAIDLAFTAIEKPDVGTWSTKAEDSTMILRGALSWPSRLQLDVLVSCFASGQEGGLPEYITRGLSRHVMS